MLSLDETIKHCEEVSEEQDMKAGFETDNQTYTMSETERERYRDCAKEHRQLAEWLRELKALRENEDVKDIFKDCDTCKYQSLEADEFPCDRCRHRYINQYVYDDKREVKADG